MDIDHCNCEVEYKDNKRPSIVQLKGEIETKDTLEEPTPGQSDNGGYGE